MKFAGLKIVHFGRCFALMTSFSILFFDSRTLKTKLLGFNPGTDSGSSDPSELEKMAWDAPASLAMERMD